MNGLQEIMYELEKLPLWGFDDELWIKQWRELGFGGLDQSWLFLLSKVSLKVTKLEEALNLNEFNGSLMEKFSF